MLQIQDISKQYKTGDLVQNALNHVSLNLRDNEFVAVLGPSGSGKTTLLNIIGGLDRYDSGDLIINGTSTKKYRDRDWDSYRNHTIGFVFQSYNLIPHQSILSNVELALTISGISKDERRRRAKEALENVGLGDHLHKKPNQLSGGQMQRVAIARALVNNPDILLADEPTGALDTETGVQVMELLKEVARDRLVIMVTHNPELAESYANRIVKLRDGVIIDDSNPYDAESEGAALPQHRNMGKSSMSFFTSLALSFNNLKSKKGRTVLTSFAGSIGIIGIALILALSTGVNIYIEDIQKDTMTSYPITIDAESVDLTSMMGDGLEAGMKGGQKEKTDHQLDGVYSDGSGLEQANRMSSSVTENNLTAFKKYLDDPDSEIHQYLGEAGAIYSYDAPFDVYTFDPDGKLVNTDGSTLTEDSGTAGTGNGGMEAMAGMMNGSAMTTGSNEGTSSSDTFEELIPGTGGDAVSAAVKDNYDVVYGSWPAEYDEVVLVLDENNEISLSTLYALGLLPSEDYQQLMDDVENEEDFQAESHHWSYEDICNQTFYLVPGCDRYEENSDGTFRYVSDEQGDMEKKAKDGIKLKVTGIIREGEEADHTSLTGAIGYTKGLTDYLIDYASDSQIVRTQKANQDENVLTGSAFKEGESYDENMERFGFVSLDAPSSISLYSDSFEGKEGITDCIENYNASAKEGNEIVYTDFVELLTSSITSIINVITYVLIAFVAVSLIVSSLMIGIITHISVLERTKEIGILRAIGASKRNISQVFNAETFIIGLCSGTLGIGISCLLLIPLNAVIHGLIGNTAVNAALPASYGIVLIILSVLLTLIGGLLPAKKAAKRDPVSALRTE